MKKERIFWGIFLIFGAIFILAAKMGFMQEVGVWSLIWTVLFAAILLKSIIKVNFFGIFMSIAFFAIIYAKPLQIEMITPWPVLGAAVLLSIGCSMIFPKMHFRKFCKKHNIQFVNGGKEQVINEEDEGNCHCSVSFGSSIKYINSEAFESAGFEVSFGSLQVYFDNAIMKGSEAYIHVDNSFGSTELYIPRTWTVVSGVESVFGGVEKKGREEPNGLHKVILQGDNSFGSISIIYV